MTAILAIETATDVCSVAVYRNGEITQLNELAPRRHNQLIFEMLRELLPEGNLRDQGIDAIAYGCGPGSFTGLRIATSAVQGLAYANQLPAIAVSTLACLAQSALRIGLIAESDRVLTAIDAKIRELYWASYEICDSLPVLLDGPGVCAPGQMPMPNEQVRSAVGDGVSLLTQLEDIPVLETHPDLQAVAQDLIPLALQKLHRGEVQRAQQVAPVYVRDEISWKKLSEQGT